jgi:glycosyltransferase involved in cell wall biosynthesis
VDGIEVFRLPNFSNVLAWNYQLFLPEGMGTFLRGRIREFDVVHLHMYRTTQDIAVYRYASRAGVPYVFSARGSLPRIVRGQAAKAFFDIAVGMRVLHGASRCIALSRAERAEYEARGVRPDRIRIILNGLDSGLFQNLPPEGSFARNRGLDGRRLIVYVGRLNARKGLDLLVRAFHDLASREPDTTLVLAGPDEGLRRRIESLARSLGLHDRIVFTGLLTGQDRIAVFVDSRVIVYPAKHEVFGLVPFEAMACGKPVVVADDSGCGEITREANAGLVVTVDDTSRLAQAISFALERGPSIEEMVDRGRHFVSERLSWEVVCAQMEATYEEVVADRSVPDLSIR